MVLSDIKKKSGNLSECIVYRYHVGSIIEVIPIFSYIENCFTAPVQRITVRKENFQNWRLNCTTDPLSSGKKQATVTFDVTEKYGDNKFAASMGCVNKFKKKHDVSHLKVSGEKLSSDQNVVNSFLPKLAEKIREMIFEPN